MKPLFAALSAALLLGTSISAQAAEQTTPTDRSIQVYKKADLAEWNRENAAGGQGPLLGSLPSRAIKPPIKTHSKKSAGSHYRRALPSANTNIPAMKTSTSSYRAKACLPTAKANKPKSAPETLPSPAPASPTHSKISAKSRWYSLI